MNVIVTPEGVYGKFRSISSKSDFLRLILCVLFSDKPTKITLNNMCDDIERGINAVKQLGAEVEWQKDSIIMHPGHNIKDYTEIDCGASGALLRFLMPCVNYFCKNVRFTGEDQLMARPIKEFIELLSNHGLKFSNNRLPFEVSGKLKNGDYFISGNISSQYISGLLFILPLLKGDSRIVVTTKLQSEKYVDLTIKRLMDFGINISKQGKEMLICGKQKYNSAGSYKTEGDWSYAASLLCVGAACGEVAVYDVDINSLQPDKHIIGILYDMGVNIKYNNSSVVVKKGIPNGITTDLSGYPDLFPVLAAVSSCASGITIFHGTERLIYKESNRLYSVSSMLNGLGANVSYSENGVKVNPVKNLSGGTVNSFGDHRVAMSATVAAKLCNKSIEIIGADCIKKSAPEFFKCLNSFTKRG